MPVEDTDFSPSATAVMFLLTIHLTTLEKGDFLSTGVKVTDGADYASQDYHRQDCYGAVHKESIRENRDDRVGVCVEDPVVVLEENMPGGSCGKPWRRGSAQLSHGYLWRNQQRIHRRTVYGRHRPGTCRRRRSHDLQLFLL